ncbi:MAG: DegQ family serine endoprotease [Verrucomicrobia bacterium]|nr:DegQ family serine endoprotease [Verrucomicrobiota bacterium]MBS0637312.1 DegQ family serine endoprotease [Verrucomicrobiota bacterium]
MMKSTLQKLVIAGMLINGYAFCETATPKVSLVKEMSKEFAQIAKKALPAVVSVRTQYSQKSSQGQDEMGQQPFGGPFPDDFFERFFGFPMPEQRGPRKGQGSGFVVSADGYILTNNHVVRDADQITISFTDGREFVGKVIGTDPNTDIALLKIEATNLPFLVLDNSDDLEIGEWVMAVGSPLRLQGSVTVGVVSAKGRSELDIAQVEQFIQTDAAINMGNSGGCLLDMDCKVVGMNTAIATNNGGYMGIGFAIPSNILKHVMDQLRDSGHVTRGYLGVSLQKIDSKLASVFNLDKSEGALVAEVVKDSPADRAGLKSGDVVLKINGKLVENVGALRSTIALMKPQESVTLTVMRNKQPVEITVTIGAHPESELAFNDIQSRLGLLVQDLTPDVAQQLGIDRDHGVIIKNVDPNSPAAEAGLRRGQLILSVNQKPVNSSEEFLRAMSELGNQKHVLLQVKAGQVVRYITLDLE